MNTKLLSLLAALALCVTACKSTTYQHTFIDGQIVKVTDRRFFVSTQADIAFEIATNGTKKATIGVKSDPQAQALADAAKALGDAAKALAK